MIIYFLCRFNWDHFKILLRWSILRKKLFFLISNNLIHLPAPFFPYNDFTLNILLLQWFYITRQLLQFSVHINFLWLFDQNRRLYYKWKETKYCLVHYENYWSFLDFRTKTFSCKLGTLFSMRENQHILSIKFDMTGIVKVLCWTNLLI